MSEERNQYVLKRIGEEIASIMSGEKGTDIDVGQCDDTVMSELCDTVNQFIASFNDMREFIKSLAEGDLEVTAPPRNLLASPFKQLQANLLHLVWQTKQIAAGDYSQRIYFMGEFSTAFNSMVESLDEKRRTEKLLWETQAKVKHLEGIIPICMYCKKIRDDKESWQQMEQYISDHSEALFSHGVCPDCYANVVRPDLDKARKKKESDKENN